MEIGCTGSVGGLAYATGLGSLGLGTGSKVLTNCLRAAHL